MAILSIIIILFLRPKGSKRLKTAVPFQAGAAGGGGDHFPTSPSPSPEAGVSPELLTVPVSADSQPTSSGTNRKARSASRRPPTPPNTAQLRASPARRGKCLRPWGTRSQAGLQASSQGGEVPVLRRHPSPLPVPSRRKHCSRGAGKKRLRPRMERLPAGSCAAPSPALGGGLVLCWPSLGRGSGGGQARLSGREKQVRKPLQGLGLSPPGREVGPEGAQLAVLGCHRRADGLPLLVPFPR